MLLTVFTPSYNRAHTLRRLFDSLCSQSSQCFEWLIVDDGSTDQTSKLLNSLMSQPHSFPIRIYKQDHGGKHRAQNMAIDLAHGNWFITCDSNKYLHPDAVRNILEAAEQVDDPMICGVGGYRSDFSGNPIGGTIKFDKRDYLDCTTIERKQYNITGDKSTAFRTEILQHYKSPEFPGEMFVTESTWLLQLALDGYKIRWTHYVFVYGEYSADGLTIQGANSRSGHKNNFMGFLCYLNLHIKAYGLSASSYMLYEAILIAKDKKMPLSELSDHLECPVSHLRKLFFKTKLSQFIHRSKLIGLLVHKLMNKAHLDALHKMLNS